jgi:hypothetical protein
MKRIAISWCVAAGLDLFRRGFEPASGPLAILFILFYIAFYGAIAVFICIVLGLPLRIPFIARLWCATPWTASLLITTGFSLFLYGVFSANYIYRDLHLGYELADRTLYTYAYPGYFLTVFPIANWPYNRRVFRCTDSEQPPPLPQ